MAKNLEFKVRYRSLDLLLPKLADLKAKRQEVINQVDTYFHNPKGRLKLRETDTSDEGWLIYYERPNTLESRYSVYQLCKVDESSVLKELMTAALGVKTIIKKQRVLWMYQNTRIHLDTVEDLGEFVELETVYQGQSDADANQEHNHVKNTLGLETAEPIAVSYSELPRDKITEKI